MLWGKEAVFDSNQAELKIRTKDYIESQIQPTSGREIIRGS